MHAFKILAAALHREQTRGGPAIERAHLFFGLLNQL